MMRSMIRQVWVALRASRGGMTKRAIPAAGASHSHTRVVHDGQSHCCVLSSEMGTTFSSGGPPLYRSIRTARHKCCRDDRHCFHKAPAKNISRKRRWRAPPMQEARVLYGRMLHWWSPCGTVAATLYDVPRTISTIYLEGQFLDLKYSLSIVSIIKCNIHHPEKSHVDLANGRQQYTESSF
jgi:hypothetical protein